MKDVIRTFETQPHFTDTRQDWWYIKINPVDHHQENVKSKNITNYLE